MKETRSEDSRSPAPPRTLRVDRVMHALRAEVGRRRQAGSTEEVQQTEHAGVIRLPRLDDRTVLAARGHLRIDQLLEHDDESFVINVYRAILGRDPDGDGWTHNLTALRHGERSKVEIAGRLRYSAEGRRRGTRVRGLAARFGVHMLCQVPVLGPILRWPVALSRLPRALREFELAGARMQHRLSERAHSLNRALERIEAELVGLPGVVESQLEAGLAAQPLVRRVENIEAAAEGWARGSRLDAVSERIGGIERAVARIRDDTAESARLEELSSALRETAGRLDELALRTARGSDLQSLASNVDTLAEQLRYVGERVSLADQVPLLARDIETIRADSAPRAAVVALETALAGLVGGPGRLTAVESALRAELRTSVEQSDATLEARHTEQLELASRLEARVDELAEHLQAHQVSLRDSDRRVRHLLEDAHKRLPTADFSPPGAALTEEYEHVWDSLYSDLEDRLRGEPRDIRDRLSCYLSHAGAALERTGDDTCVDLGCGRGEWLELVREQGWTGTGVDRNYRMVERSAELGLDVQLADVRGYLRERRDETVSVLTAFHILEHLPFEELAAIVDDANRTLRSGGIAIFETPNPENLLVGACNFYADPTHRNPLYPPTLAFLLERRGFEEVQILRPAAPEIPEWMQPLDAGDPVAARLNTLLVAIRSWFAVSPDFAVIGRKT